MRTFQDARLFAGLTVFENVEAAAVASGRRARRGARRGLGSSWTHLQPRAARARLPAGGAAARRRSGGSAIARALAAAPVASCCSTSPPPGSTRPSPTSSSPRSRELRDAFGVGLLVIEHDMRLIMRLCERIQVLDHGKTIALGTPDGDPRRSRRCAAAYLGSREDADAERR